MRISILFLLISFIVIFYNATAASIKTTTHKVTSTTAKSHTKEPKVGKENGSNNVHKSTHKTNENKTTKKPEAKASKGKKSEATTKKHGHKTTTTTTTTKKPAEAKKHHTKTTLKSNAGAVIDQIKKNAEQSRAAHQNQDESHSKKVPDPSENIENKTTHSKKHGSSTGKPQTNQNKNHQHGDVVDKSSGNNSKKVHKVKQAMPS